jgi:hypothetical protein
VTCAGDRGNLTAVIWKEESDVHILTKMHRPPAEGSFHDKHGKAQKPVIVEDYSHHVGYIDRGDRMANSYSVSVRT